MIKKLTAIMLALLFVLTSFGCAEAPATKETKTAETAGTNTSGTTGEPTAEPTEIKGAVIYVDASADASAADGTKAHPFASLNDAAPAVAAIDRTANEQITVVMAKGTYSEINLNDDFSGTETCPVVILCEDGAVVSGGVTLDPAKFVPADGETAAYFSEEAKPHIVMLDLKQYGVTPDIVDALNFQHQGPSSRSASLVVNGERKSIARYPNKGDFITIRGVDEKEPGLSVFNVLKADAERARSWHSIEKAYVSGWFKFWYRQNSGTLEAVAPKRNSMTVRNIYTDDGVPYEKMVFYVYNIPEELDEAGEYYIDENAVLYYYPEDGFETANITLPINTSEILVALNAKWLTIDGMKVSGSRSYGIYGGTEHITLKNVEVYGVRDGIELWGSDNLIVDSDIHDIGFVGVSIHGGDSGNLIKSNSSIRNSKVHDFGQIGKSYYCGIFLEGCGNTISHCDIYNCPHEAVTIAGPYNTLEYSELYNCVNETDDIGAVSAGGQFCCYGSVIAYNYIHDNTPLYPEIIDKSAYYRCYCSGIYLDGGLSGFTIKNNLIMNVTGDGIILNGGRDHTVENNVVVNCGTACISYSQAMYDVLAKGNMSEAPGGYMENEKWYETFPGYKDMIRENPADLADTTADHWYACGGSVLKNNVVYSSSTARHPTGTNIADCPLRFSDIEMPTAYQITDGVFPTADELAEKYGDLLGIDLSKVGIEK